MKLCKDCEHYRVGATTEDDACNKAWIKNEPDLVRGQGARRYALRCHVARYGIGVCGLEARLFQPTTSAFVPFDFCRRCGERMDVNRSSSCKTSDRVYEFHTWQTAHGPIVKKEYWTDTP